MLVPGQATRERSTAKLDHAANSGGFNLNPALNAEEFASRGPPNLCRELSNGI